MHFTESKWDTAYHWLCKQRRNYPINSDIWHLRFHWESEKLNLIKDLNSGCYQFSPLQQIDKKNGQTIHLLSSRDALVLNLLTLNLSKQLPISAKCTHIKSHCGLKATINTVN